MQVVVVSVVIVVVDRSVIVHVVASEWCKCVCICIYIYTSYKNSRIQMCSSPRAAGDSSLVSLDYRNIRVYIMRVLFVEGV